MWSLLSARNFTVFKRSLLLSLGSFHAYFTALQAFPILVKYLHCNPLQGNYRVELLHWEIPVVITGNEFTEYNFLLFWLHFFPCFYNIEIVALVPVMCTGNWEFILQGLKGCFNTLYSLQDHYRVELLHREIPVVITGNGFAVHQFLIYSQVTLQNQKWIFIANKSLGTVL